MPKVTVMPDGISFEMDDQTSLLESLRKNGLYVKSSCGGKASCSDCIVKIKQGEDNLSPQEYPELKLVGNVFHITKERLSCQTKIIGDVILDISMHDQKLARPYELQGLKNVKEEIKTKLRTPQEQDEINEEREQKRLEKREDFQKRRGEMGGFSRPKQFKVGEEEEREKPNSSDRTNNYPRKNNFDQKRPFDKNRNRKPNNKK